MCLILFGLQARSDLPLVIAANRDEFHHRPTAMADFWPNHPDVLGGRDLQAGGGWMALHRAGKLAAVTNHRDGAASTSPHSRGRLVSQFVAGDSPATQHIEVIRSTQDEYGGFNLLLYDRTGMHYLSNRSPVPAKVAPGVHGLSNALLDTPWPKVEQGKQRLGKMITLPPDRLVTALLDLLADRTLAPEATLPSTGVTRERERLLSPAFIQSPEYGTRASTVVLLHADGRLHFTERSFDAWGVLTSERGFDLTGFEVAT